MGRESLSVELELPLSCQLQVLAAVSFTCIFLYSEIMNFFTLGYHYTTLRYMVLRMNTETYCTVAANCRSITPHIPDAIKPDRIPKAERNSGSYMSRH